MIMDWTNLLLAVGIIYIAYEAGKWSQREQFRKQSEMQFVIIKALEQAQQQKHYQDIVDKNEKREQEQYKDEYHMESKQLWEHIEDAEQDIEWEELTGNDKETKDERD